MLLFFVAVSQSACGGDSKTSNTDSSKLQDPPEGSTKRLTADFRILFLRNYSKPDSNQLENLLNNPTASDKAKKIVFQFFHDSINELTLTAYAGKLNHKNFNTFPYRPILEVSKFAPATKVDIINQNVSLSDQEISKKDYDGKDRLMWLENHVNMSGFEYITFTPKLQIIDNRTYVVYEIGYWKKDDFDKNGVAFVAPSRSGYDLNPSPPRDGY